MPPVETPIEQSGSAASQTPADSVGNSADYQASESELFSSFDSMSDDNQPAGSETQNPNGGEVASDAADNAEAAEADSEGEIPQPESEVEALNRKISMLEHLYKSNLQQRQEQPIDPVKLQEILQEEFSFSLPTEKEEIAKFDGLSDETKELFSAEPGIAKALGEVVNLVMQQQSSFEKRRAEAQKSLGTHQKEMIDKRNDELKANGINPNFLQSDSFLRYLKEDPGAVSRSQDSLKAYGGAYSHAAIANIFADFRGWAHKNNVRISTSKMQQAASNVDQTQSSRINSSPSSPHGAPKPSEEDELFARFDAMGR